MPGIRGFRHPMGISFRCRMGIRRFSRRGRFGLRGVRVLCFRYGFHGRGIAMAAFSGLVRRLFNCLFRCGLRIFAAAVHEFELGNLCLRYPGLQLLFDLVPVEKEVDRRPRHHDGNEGIGADGRHQMRIALKECRAQMGRNILVRLNAFFRLTALPSGQHAFRLRGKACEIGLGKRYLHASFPDAPSEKGTVP